ncbi:MAG: hypothetical protein FWC70_01430 [Defluviitaleaceae bacterium]|nr:hypothetical protein [Defluviitaleaceae bacterium]
MSRFLFFASILLLIFCMEVEAAPRTPEELADSPAVILVEQTTGRVLYARNERERRYPAHLTNMLTALVAAEHLAVEEEIIVGTEIRVMPPGFGLNVHSEGEVATVHTLLNSLLVRSSGEAARVLALNTVRRTEGRRNIPYTEAERAFAVLMNEKALSLGARGSHFANPFGGHADNHFTTAYDLAIITRAFMQNPILAEITGTGTYGEWTNSNQMLPDAPLGYIHMTGGIAGLTTPAGHVFAGAAHDNRRDLGFVTIVLGGTDPQRWSDTRRLMDYAFYNYHFREIVREGQILQTVLIENPRLGDPDVLEIIAAESHVVLLNHAEYEEIEKTITFDPLLEVLGAENPTLRAPVEYGEAAGRAAFLLNGEVLFEAAVLPAREVIPRSFDSDMDYYLAAIIGNVFTRRALPYWFGVFGVAFGIFGIVLAIKSRTGSAVRTSGRFGRY